MNIVHAVITCVIAFAAAFAAAWLMGFEEPEGNGKEGKPGDCLLYTSSSWACPTTRSAGRPEALCSVRNC